MKPALRHLIAFCLLCLPALVRGQATFSFEKDSVVSRLKKDIGTLAHDSLEGRSAGSAGEEKAYIYLVQAMQEAGLKPYFADSSFTQAFNSSMYAFTTNNTYLTVNDRSIPRGGKAGSFYPLAYSANARVEGEIVDLHYGIIAPELGYSDYTDIASLQGKIALIETSIPGGYTDTSLFVPYRYIRKKMDTAIHHGASAIIFINSDPNYLNPTGKLNLSVIRRDIPVIFYNGIKENLLKDGSHAQLNVELTIYESVKATNVAGYLDNQAAKTVIIGAHYDHLGTSKASNTEDHVYNGADDNASGTAGVLEMARYIKTSQLKHYNYVFVLFSGEEKGLLGSKHFVKNNPTGLEHIAFMLNLDMIGRSGCKNSDMIVYGVGSATCWRKQLKAINNKVLHMNLISGSNGGSDHHPFYKAGIPVLFFFTGIHADYHKVSDEIELLNFEGEAEILTVAEKLVMSMENEKAPKFRKIGPLRNGISYLGILF
ncbi:M20/M25/M40 family metallo-hydrolase [Bacteroidota bacterium]